MARLAIISSLALGALINATILCRSNLKTLYYTTYEYIHCFFLTRMVGIRLLRFLRLLLRYKIYTFEIILLHRGIAIECTAGDIIIIYP